MTDGDRPHGDDLAGRVVLVSGGARGIGQATAQAFLRRGAKVAIFSKNPASLRAAEERLRGRGALLAEVADVTDTTQVVRVVEAVAASFGDIDVVVNSAGAAWSGDFAAQNYDSIDTVIDVNVKGLLYVTRAVLPGMLARGRGVIVNVASGAGLVGFAGLATYCTSKFGVVGFTEALDPEVRERGIRVYAVCPGRVATDMQLQYSGRRIGLAPERVAERIVRLAGPDPNARPGSCLEL